MSILLYAILAYILYQFIFKLVIPVYLASRQIKKGFRDMHEKMQGQDKQNDTDNQQSKNSPKPKAGEYIDFEEVK